MSGAARAVKLDTDNGGTVEKAPSIKAVAPKMPEVPSTMHINMKVHDLGDVKVGQTMGMKVEGKVTSHNHDKYGHTVSLELSKLDHGGGRGGNASNR